MVYSWSCWLQNYPNFLSKEEKNENNNDKNKMENKTDTEFDNLELPYEDFAHSELQYLINSETYGLIKSQLQKYCIVLSCIEPFIGGHTLCTGELCVLMDSALAKQVYKVINELPQKDFIVNCIEIGGLSDLSITDAQNINKDNIKDIMKEKGNNNDNMILRNNVIIQNEKEFLHNECSKKQSKMLKQGMLSNYAKFYNPIYFEHKNGKNGKNGAVEATYTGYPCVLAAKQLELYFGSDTTIVHLHDKAFESTNKEYLPLADSIIYETRTRLVPFLLDVVAICRDNTATAKKITKRKSKKKNYNHH